MNEATRIHQTIARAAAAVAFSAALIGGMTANAETTDNVGTSATDETAVTLERLQTVYPEMTADQFAVLDTNRDGVLNKQDELGRYRGHRGPRPEGVEPRGPRGPRSDGMGPRGPRPEGESRGRFLAKADTDGDGGISLEELRAIRPDATEELFQKRDTNGDGVLNRADRPDDRGFRKQGHPGNRDMRVRDHRGPGRDGMEGPGRRGPGRDGMEGPRPAGPPPMLDKADSDGNGEVTREEWIATAPEWAGTWFDRMDRNGDGVLNREDGPPRRGPRN